jgi:hypothetical protein
MLESESRRAGNPDSDKKQHALAGSKSNFRLIPESRLSSQFAPGPKSANTGLARWDHLIEFAPYANTQRTKPSDFARGALGVSDDEALQELSGQRRSRDKDWPPRN